MRIQTPPPANPVPSPAPKAPQPPPGPEHHDSFLASAGTAALPMAGALIYGVPGALAGGAASVGAHCALGKGVGRAAGASLLPTMLGVALGATGQMIPTPYRLGLACAVAVGLGLTAEDKNKPTESIQHINVPGQAVKLEDHLVHGKTNIVWFGATWCPPCKKVAPDLEKFAQEHPDHAVMKIDIRDWESPVVKQFGITGVPAFQIYDGDGKLVAEGDEARSQVKARLYPPA